MSDLPSFESDLAGIQFRPAEVKDLIKSLAIGEPLTLERDRENPWDDNAVKILRTEDDGEPVFLGFIQKFVAQSLGPLLDAGHQFSCVLKSFQGPKAVPVLSITPTGEQGEPYVPPDERHTPDFNPHGADDDIPF